MGADQNARDKSPDLLTLFAVSALAYVLAVGLHEHAGHSTACTLLGSHVDEMGAFYVNCDDQRLSHTAVRLVAIAGPAMSLFTGLVAYLVLPRIAASSASLYYFTWLLGSLGLMEATGYLLFSGIAGIGDLGTTQDGALAGANPEWLWRAVLAIAGAALYFYVVRLMCQRIAPCAGKLTGAHLPTLRRATAMSYYTGAAIYVAIGLFNPVGWKIILISVLPSSMGGTSGLLWMWHHYRHADDGDGAGLAIPRDWKWIGVSLAVLIAYTVLFGRSWRLS